MQRPTGSSGDVSCTHLRQLPISTVCARPLAPGLKRGPFHVGDLVLTRRLQTLKGHSPYAGPFRVIKVLGRYSYQLSDGQKWNTWVLMHYLPPSTTWMELMGLPAAEGNQAWRQ